MSTLDGAGAVSARQSTSFGIPSGPAELTASWLSAVLCHEGIAGADVAPVGAGQIGETYRISVSFEERTAGLPVSFIAKLSSSDPEVRERVAPAYQSEVAFYRSVVNTVRVPAPHCFHHDISDDGKDFVLLLSDLAPAVQGDQIRGCTADEARLAVQALAGLHAPRWCDPAWLAFADTSMPKPTSELAKVLGEFGASATSITFDRLGANMTAADRDTLQAAMSLVERWLMLEPDRFSLLHGDYRLDNLMFDTGAGTVSVVDWQTLAVGLPARDLSYFVATSLEPAGRREADEALVAAYHDELVAQGVSGYSSEACWHDYRLGMLQAPLISTLANAYAAQTERGDEIQLIMLRRACAAIRDLDTLALIG